MKTEVIVPHLPFTFIPYDNFSNLIIFIFQRPSIKRWKLQDGRQPWYIRGYPVLPGMGCRCYEIARLPIPVSIDLCHI